MLSVRENYLRAIEFKCPEWIPCGMHFAPLTWKTYRKDLEKIVMAHPGIFPEYKEGSVNFDEMPPVYRQGEYFRDNWGCLWYNNQEGLEGQVVEHPLADWNNLATYQSPDPMLKEERGDAIKDWKQIRKSLDDAKKKGFIAGGSGERLFDRLYFLRGFENLMVDIATDDLHLPKLIQLVEDYEMKLVNAWLPLGVDVMYFHTDIGTQEALMISPDKFRKYIKPMFKRIFQICRNSKTHVYLSSDGCHLEIVDDLIECGVSVHDPQLRANGGAKGIAKAYKGKLCVDVDLDRQSFPFVKPEELRNQVKEVVDTIGSPEGGLMIKAGIFGGDVPLKNIEAICFAFEEFCFA